MFLFFCRFKAENIFSVILKFKLVSFYSVLACVCMGINVPFIELLLALNIWLFSVQFFLVYLLVFRLEEGMI